jgi:4-hydroxy 2-oxovalerate aldolase
MNGSPVILDCTIRDGSYAVDFKFTAEDTATIAEQLQRIGIRYIEVGHGLGLGASEAGKGVAASHDIDVLERTKARITTAGVGMFFIPGIGTADHLRAAAAAGLDFVRIGQNADAIEEAWPFVELARELGVEPFVNFMKTYGILPTQFAESSRAAAEVGAAGVYVVDSAGGMLPHEVTEYVETTRGVTPLPIGFHGHSNLHLAVANSLAALDAGATYIDTSLYGIGRSSGNVPTEVMVAVLDRLGIDTGVDPQAAIDVAEAYLRPLAEHLHPHDMTAVSLGYGRFHSSFLPRALRAAEENDVNPFRLIVALGRRDVMNMSEELLADVIAELRHEQPPEVRREVASFSADSFGPLRISNRPQAVAELLDGLEVVAAKRHLQIALDLVVTESLDEEVVSAEFVLEDREMALGRLRAGSVEALVESLPDSERRVAVALVDPRRLPSRASLARLRARLADTLVPYDLDRLELSYLGDAAAAIALHADAAEIAVVDVGAYSPASFEGLVSRLGSVVPVRRDGATGGGGADLAVVAGPLGSALTADARLVVFLGGGLDGSTRVDPSVIVLERSDAFRGTLPRWVRAQSAAAAVPAAESVP